MSNTTNTSSNTSNNTSNNISNYEWDLIDSKKTTLKVFGEKIENLDKKMESLEDKLDSIILLLKQNRKLYTQALKQVEEKEDKTYNEVKNKSKSQALDINRVSNLIWRGGITTPNLSINTLALTGGLGARNINSNISINNHNNNHDVTDDSCTEDNSIFRSARFSCDSLESIE